MLAQPRPRDFTDPPHQITDPSKSGDRIQIVWPLRSAFFFCRAAGWAGLDRVQFDIPVTYREHMRWVPKGRASPHISGVEGSNRIQIVAFVPWKLLGRGGEGTAQLVMSLVCFFFSQFLVPFPVETRGDGGHTCVQISIHPYLHIPTTTTS
jgi:hypothetical protein